MPTKSNLIKGESHAPSIHIGRTVRLLREKQNLTGAELCKRSGNLDPKTLTAVEKGRIRNPSIQTLESLGRGLGMTVSAIFRQAELGSEKYFLRSSQKGVFHLQFATGIELVSFTPFTPGLFCGKFIIGGRKKLDRELIRFDGAIFAMTLVGNFRVSMEQHELEIGEGENLYFHGSFDFSFYNPNYRNAVLLVVTAPSFLSSGGAGEKFMQK